MFGFFFYLYRYHHELHVLTPSFPTRRSSDLEKKWVCTSMDLTDRRSSDWDRIEFLYSRSPIMAEFMVHDILDGTVRSEICQLAGVLEPFGDRHLQLR